MRIDVLALTIPLVTGCVELRKDFIQPTGEPMRIYDRTVTKSGIEAVEVGRAEHYDRNGNSAGSTVLTQNQVVHWQERTWYPMQGTRRIDDESFYRITNDTDAIARYDQYHKSARTRGHVSLSLIPIGAALAAGGIALYAVDTPKKDPMTMMTTTRGGVSTGGYVLMGVGAVALLLGIGTYFVNRKAASAPDVRLFEQPERMKRDAQIYNAQLSMQPGLGGFGPGPAPTLAPRPSMPPTPPPPPAYAPRPGYGPRPRYRPHPY